MNTVAFHTFGCKLNFSETSTIERKFKQKGYKKISINDNPNKVIINTCSVTENADKKCKELIKKIKNKSPKTEIDIIGCYAQLKPKEISKINGVNLVLGTKEKFKVSNYFNNNKEKILHSNIKEITKFNSTYSIDDRTRSFLKIQDGCNYRCSFCTIPLARGKSRSNTINEILNRINNLISKGLKEIVLSGINIGDFGIINGKRKESFVDLIIAIEQINKEIRFRISSIEPNLLNDKIIEVISKSNKFLNHFHMPLQSGNNKILKSMSRRYTKELYQERVKKIKFLMPDACIGSDVIVGFPGESNLDFKKTYEFINNLNVDYLHVFPYSERVNTRADIMKDKIPTNERALRSKMLRILSDKKKRFFYNKNIGLTKNVLFEKSKKNNWVNGFTENYIKVKVPYNNNIIGKIMSVRLRKTTNDLTVIGDLI